MARSGPHAPPHTTTRIPRELGPEQARARRARPRTRPPRASAARSARLRRWTAELPPTVSGSHSRICRGLSADFQRENHLELEGTRCLSLCWSSHQFQRASVPCALRPARGGSISKTPSARALLRVGARWEEPTPRSLRKKHNHIAPLIFPFCRFRLES